MGFVVDLDLFFFFLWVGGYLVLVGVVSYFGVGFFFGIFVFI